MRGLFIDSGYLVALGLDNDSEHELVTLHWDGVLESSIELLTTSFILDEVATFFNSRGRHDKAVSIGRTLLHSDMVDLVHVDVELFEAGWEYFCRHNDKGYSLTDCISFVFMQEQGIDTALTFDHHFEQAGFRIEP